MITFKHQKILKQQAQVNSKQLKIFQISVNIFEEPRHNLFNIDQANWRILLKINDKVS